MSGMSIAASAPAKSATARSSQSRGDYCIFLDGDCIARPDFVATHRALAERGWFVTGNRILMSQDFTRRVLARQARAGKLEFRDLGRRERSRGGINRARAVLRLPLGPLRKMRPGAWQRRALLQSRGLAHRSRPRRWFRRGLQRLGPGGFRSAGAAAACRRAAQGRRFRDRRAASLASGGRPFGAAGQRQETRSGPRREAGEGVARDVVVAPRGEKSSRQDGRRAIMTFAFKPNAAQRESLMGSPTALSSASRWRCRGRHRRRSSWSASGPW